MDHPNSFPKAEHLCGEITIGRLFTQGQAFIAYPMRVVFLVLEKSDASGARVMVNVPKKRFKRAVKRNRLKRLMREAYRLNKHILAQILAERGMQLHLAFNYVSDDELDFTTIDRKMKQALEKIIEKTELSGT